MTLKLKTNRFNIWAWWLILLVPYVVVYAMIFYFTYISNDEILKSKTDLVIGGGIFLAICFSAIMFYHFYDRRLQVFSNTGIQVFEKKQLVDYINVDDILEIKYIKCNIQYLWKRLSGDSMQEGYACKMYVYMKQGNCYILGCFSVRDVKKIKKLYGDLVKICRN